MAYHSAEIQWFAADARHWMRIYEQIPWLADTDDREPTRTDHYLATGEAGIGIKRREGRLEIKYRAGAPKLLEVREKAIGQMVTWVKWSLEEAGAAIRPVGDNWLAVRKERRRKWFAVRGYQLVPAPRGSYGGEGCCVEFTKVVVEDQTVRYSLGYEAFSARGAEERNLIYTIEQTLSPTTGLPEAALCRSYPELLQEFYA